MHRKLALTGVAGVLGILAMAGPALATNHCRITLSATSIVAGGTITVAGTDFPVGHIAVTVTPGAPFAPDPPPVAAGGTISFSVGPLNTAGTYTVHVEGHGTPLCTAPDATLSVTAAPAPAPPPAGGAAPTQAPTGVIPNVAMSAPHHIPDATLLGLLFLSSAAVLWTLRFRERRAH